MILLMRHGETVFNVERRLQGRADSPLTEKGRRQAAAQGRLIASLGPDRRPAEVVCSPLGRARATADLMCRAGGLPHARVDERLMEVSFGRWEGLTLAEVSGSGATARLAWADDCPDGEPYAEAAARARDWLVAAKGRRVVAVTHGVFASLLIGAYAGLGRHEVLRLHVPNDALFGLAHGCVQRLDGGDAGID